MLINKCNKCVFRLLTMHNGLMKRYERELKINMQHVETITNLNVAIYNTL